MSWRGRPLQRPRHLYADRGYDHEIYRDNIHQAFITLGCAIICWRRLKASS